MPTTTTTTTTRVLLGDHVATAIARHPLPRYKIAELIRVPDTTLAGWLSGRARPLRQDSRLVGLARLIGLTQPDQLWNEGSPNAD